ncbi:MAG: hypothetical protein KIT31_11780 [Deltaproteobacteria bacterium]|nr:hypothetical protein [Deltaproteobacteria bacterium]
MRRYLFVLIIAAGAFAVANTSRRSAAENADTDAAGTSNPDEPITGEPARPHEAPPSVLKSPTEPYGIGETTAETHPAWSYQQLSSAEQAIVDRGRESRTTQWTAIHNSYKQAAALRATRAAAQAAAIQLGIEGLGEGVVP